MPPRAARKKSKKKPLKLSNKKTKKNMRFVVMSILMLIFASTIVFSGLLYKRVTTVFASAHSSDSLDFAEKDIHTLLIASADNIGSTDPHVKNMALIVMDAKDNEITIVNLDNQAEFEIPGKFGKEKAYNLMTLANSVYSDENEANAFFSKIIENNVKFEIDNYIYVNDNRYASIKSLFSKYSGLKYAGLLKDFALDNVVGQVSTNVTDRELYAIFEFLSKEPLTKTENNLQFQKSISDIVFNSNIAEEKFMISILNGASISGVATYASNVVENAGGRVTFVGNAKNSYNESILVTDNPDSQSVKYLKSFFKIDKVESKSKFSFIEGDVERADVTVILGIDFTKNIY